MKRLLLAALWLLSLGVYPQQKNRLYVSYVETYKDIAMAHQRRYGVPASITLAQGLLESGAGNGRLARQANNHFGIKCHDWTGPKIYHDDDRRGECFRKYRHAEESYEDHSRFLTGRSRYACLFDLKVTDYKGWARGLQRCGYATDKAYAAKLIKLIEDYELHRYDQSRPARKKSASGLPSDYRPHTVYKSYGLLYVEARDEDRLAYIAQEFGFKEKKLAKYNEIPVDYPLGEGDIVYLEKKNKKADKAHRYHLVQAGESMYSISQLYGMRMKTLYKLNKKDGEYTPAEGDLLKLR